jgi:hypothetical protein
MLTFKQFITEVKADPSQQDELYKSLKLAWELAIKDIYDLFGGYAAVQGKLHNNTNEMSYIEIALPKKAFDKDELDPELTKIGIEKAFRDHNLDVSIISYTTHLDDWFDDKSSHRWVLEFTLKPTGRLSDVLMKTRLPMVKAYMMRKFKR